MLCWCRRCALTSPRACVAVRWRARSPRATAPPAAGTAGDPERGRLLLRQYGCGTCHAIPGVATADGQRRPAARRRRAPRLSRRRAAEHARQHGALDPRAASDRAADDDAGPAVRRGACARHGRATSTGCADMRRVVSRMVSACSRSAPRRVRRVRVRGRLQRRGDRAAPRAGVLAARSGHAPVGAPTRARHRRAAARRCRRAIARGRALLRRALRAMPRRARRRAGAVRAGADAARRRISRTPRASGRPPSCSGSSRTASR